MDVLTGHTLPVNDTLFRDALLFEFGIGTFQNFNSLAALHIIGDSLPFENLAFEQILDVSIYMKFAVLILIVV